MPETKATLGVDVDRSGGGNPVIKGVGTVSFSGGHFCTWNTNNGSNSQVTISNPGQANTLTFTVNGAPSSITCNDPNNPSFDGTHSIPPNDPTGQIIANADFQGTTVTITNFSNPSATCEVQVQQA